VAQPQVADIETNLIELAQNGDRSAFGELVRHHYQRVVQVVYRMCGDMGLAEDAAQETFIRAWMNLKSYEPTGCLRNWLYRIAVNAALDVLRRKPEEMLKDEEAWDIPDQTAGPEIALMEKEQRVLLQKSMKSLPEAARSALVLREYGGLSYQEIAGVLNVPVGTVMSRLNYARNHLRKKLRPYLTTAESNHA
jgi:RNA polymerase sigma-70 factor (ECF subfamily)